MREKKYIDPELHRARIARKNDRHKANKTKKMIEDDRESIIRRGGRVSSPGLIRGGRRIGSFVRISRWLGAKEWGSQPYANHRDLVELSGSRACRMRGRSSYLLQVRDPDYKALAIHRF